MDIFGSIVVPVKKFEHAPLMEGVVAYDHDNPSDLFAPEDVDYIESITADFSGEDLDYIRSIEQFKRNVHTANFGGDEILGLRKPRWEHSTYVRRFSSETWKTFISEFFDELPPFGDIKNNCCRLYRFTLPNGDRYYPISFWGDVDSWRSSLMIAAERCGTVLGNFERGAFVTSDGQAYRISSMVYELPPRKRIPKHW